MMKKGFTLIELLIVVAIIAILAAIAVPNFLEAQVRSKVSRAKSDMRSYATGIESYYVDNNSYPVRGRTGAPGSVESINRYLVNMTTPPPGLQLINSFGARTSTLLHNTMTTPISYVTSYFPDPFMDSKGATFGYYTDTNGWILYSMGPDTDQEPNGGDLENGSAHSVETVYTSTVSQPSVLLISGAGTQAYTYDPTNGTVSPGDVWRVKQ